MIKDIRIITSFLFILLLALLLVGCDNPPSENVVTINEENKDYYEDTLFDTSYVHKINIDIAEDDWEDLKQNAINKTKYKVNVTIDGETINEVSFATKGNSSLKTISLSDSDRYCLPQEQQ